MEMAEKENSEGVRSPMELSEFIVEVSAMVYGDDKTPVLDWIEYGFRLENKHPPKSRIVKLRSNHFRKRRLYHAKTKTYPSRN